ncbi:NAD-dependent succinate-semialdehyde dehydrogenase [Algimonas porphyrae]|uniref:Succinate-semialdehyde dehydrogenase [NADP(+)] 1 n=1 Tax=Algimonas porphyrae TaxID=1128113 RepID=A0ABQ5V204_9PROT|nr:NAD-dependent succinate-semialdehyde dehydrogenase [Algimonas porphyrae]GLQ21511.1 succinate-semialdehyde dehydrogenase [NADP(+)] 1 [Algimonas porphyrae]
MPIATTNPATGKIEKTFEPHTDAEVDLAIARAVVAFEALKDSSFAERADWMHKAADILESDADEFGRIMTLEMGKPLSQAIAESKKCAWVCRYYADHAEAIMADEPVDTDRTRSFRRILPIGPVLAVMPWNYPFWQVMRFAAPALMAGNTGLLKHASNVPQCALAMEMLFTRAGFPEGAFQALLVGGAKVERILRDGRVRAATLTGSEPAGASVASICGQEIKPTVLELGGSDAFIVMPSADLDKAVEVGIKARTQNNGQSCIAAKRFIIHADIYDDFRDRMKDGFEALRIGDPMYDDTDIGPLVNPEAVEELCGQVDNALSQGALRVCGGQAIDQEGSWFRPGIIEGVTEDMDAYSEEMFGPVAMLFKVSDLDEAIALANDSPFGLGSSVFTQDEAEMERVFTEIESGATFVNAMTASDPRLPFGGIKVSGYGRELAREGLLAFCNIKTCVVD